MTSIKKDINKEDQFKLIYTADDEDPDCSKCESYSSGLNICNKCGPEYFWMNYRRCVNFELGEYD